MLSKWNFGKATYNKNVIWKRRYVLGANASTQNLEVAEREISTKWDVFRSTQSVEIENFQKKSIHDSNKQISQF